MLEALKRTVRRIEFGLGIRRVVSVDDFRPSARVMLGKELGLEGPPEHGLIEIVRTRRGLTYDDFRIDYESWQRRN